ncbi:hypothetical protein DOTSEDRAFT_71179 [Dothistroma septosporum NZE10]|uniref:Uncharacterized protein n=1 Tax=Dothistroma septosporum (strain NZE10 / CBS 128990) TaxID=675120 RepID=N1PPK5_DOTSN|nr:hypothetical protein DOTSEDRAFT_71179 [Dothistroma septosporum NZE10]
MDEEVVRKALSIRLSYWTRLSRSGDHLMAVMIWRNIAINESNVSIPQEEVGLVDIWNLETGQRLPGYAPKKMSKDGSIKTALTRRKIPSTTPIRSISHQEAPRRLTTFGARFQSPSRDSDLTSFLTYTSADARTNPIASGLVLQIRAEISDMKPSDPVTRRADLGSIAIRHGSVQSEVENVMRLKSNHRP